MTTPTLDFRPAGFRFRWPPAGATTVALRAPVGTLAGRELRMWVQPKALSLPDLEQATATATISDVTTEEVDGDEFDVAVATFADVAVLTQATWYRVLLADGDQVWVNGLVKTSNDGTDEQSTTLNVTVASGSIELQITVAPAGPGGGTGLPAGTAGQMFRIAADGETTEAVSPNAPGAWLRLNGTGHVPDVHLSSDIVRESEMASAISSAIDDLVGGAPGALDTLNELAAALNDDEAFAATVAAALATKVTAAEVEAQIDARDLPVNAAMRVPFPVSAFGGTIGGGTATVAALAGVETGRSVWFDDQVDPDDDGFYQHDGAGVFTQLAEAYQPLLNADFVGRSIDVGVDLGNDALPSLWVISSDGVTINAVRAAVRPDQLLAILADYALSDDLATADAVVAAAAELADQRQAHADELAAGITNVFRCNGIGTGRWSTPNLTDEFTTGISVRTLMIPRRPPSLPFFGEMFTQPHDNGGTDPVEWDNFEQAVIWPDDSFNDDSVSPDRPLVEGRPEMFWEQTESGGSTDGSGLFIDCLLAADQAVEVMTVITFGTSTGQHWLRVPHELDDGGTYHVDADDGATFRLMGQKVSAKFASIDPHTEEWWLGQNFSGDIARVIVRDGLDGTLIANPDASQVTPGATSFIDGAGNTWTAGAAAEVVSLGTGIGAYSPATPGDWSPAPTTTAEALDQLAARLAVLEP